MGRTRTEGGTVRHGAYQAATGRLDTIGRDVATPAPPGPGGTPPRARCRAEGVPR